MATPPDFSVGATLTAAQMNQIGIWKVTPTSVAGTGVALSGSDVTMAGTGGSASLNGVFNSNYRAYRIVINHTVSSQVLYFRLRASGSDITANNYSYAATYQAYSNGAQGVFYGVNLSTNVIGYCDVNTTAISTFDIENPALSLPTNITGGASWQGAGGSVSGYHSLFTAYDGFTIFAASGTISGQIQVYGYN
jgi:hypothetical protein